jgi:hypothetical protein
MSKTARALVSLAVCAGAMLPALGAHAQCCAGYSLATVCAGQTLTKSRWCIQDTAPTGQSSLPKEFCAYGDKVVDTLETTFNIKAPSIFEFELDTKTGGAHTGTGCQNFGDGVAYDAFSGSAYGATYYWGYLLAMHEAINDWTGLASSGWPTDWWADHQSAFPNLMDFHIMNSVGVANNDMNLITAAAAQKKRFYPGGDSSDAKVVALDNVYGAMPNGDGFAGFSHMFALQTGDGVKWDSLGVPNPDVKRSEYVTAYMSLATGKTVLPLLQGPGANGGGKICNNTPDGTQGDAPYTCNEAHVDAIATAHCSIAANGKPAADLNKLRAGTYDGIASGPCGATCPSECACDTSNHCVAPWLGKQQAGAGGAGGMSSGGASGAGTSGGGLSGAGAGAPNLGAGGAESGGAPEFGGATGTPGAGAASAGGSFSAAGNVSTAGSGAPETTPDSSSGCSCRTAGDNRNGTGLAGLLFASALAGVGLRRARARKPARNRERGQ